jgi:O-antigen/teichoic acid export membrane protein
VTCFSSPWRNSAARSETYFRLTYIYILLIHYSLSRVKWKRDQPEHDLMGTIDIPKPSAPSTEANSPFTWVLEGLGSHAREYGGTFATEFTVLACQLLTYKLAAHFLGKTGFSEYAVARRTISLIYPLPLLGMAVALPRYVAHAIGGGNGDRKERYFGAAVWCMGLGLLTCVLLMNLFPGVFAYFFFAGREYANLVPPLSALLVGLVLHTLVYSYLRGCLAMRRANLLQLINYGIVPLTAFALFSSSLRSVLLAMGILATVAASVALILTPIHRAAERVMPEAKELLNYGLQRVPGDFSQMALFTLPTVIVAHVDGIQTAGSVAFGISVVGMIASVFSPVGLVLLPKASWMLAAGASREIALHVRQIGWVTVLFSLSITFLLAIFAPSLIALFLGPGFGHVTASVRVLVWGAVPFSVYYVLRGIIDAFHQSGINTRNLIFALLSLVAIAGGAKFIGKSVSAAVSISFLASLYFLALLTLYETRKIIVRIQAEQTRGAVDRIEAPFVS